LNEFLAVVIARKDDIILKRTKHEQMFDTDENSD
jgi:hypothetical protein